MSKTLLAYLFSNLPVLRAETYTDTDGTVRRPLDGVGLALLGVLCNGANDRNGRIVYWSISRMVEETGASPTAVKRSLAAFEAAGWIERTGATYRAPGQRGRGTPVYRVTLSRLPGDDDDTSSEADAIKDRKRFSQVPTWGYLDDEKPIRENENGLSRESETGNPKPEPANDSTTPAPARPGSGGRERSTDDRHRAVVAEAVGIEAERYRETHTDEIGNPLRQHWRNELAPHVEAVLTDSPGEFDTMTLAHAAHGRYLAAKGWAWQRGTTAPPAAPTVPRHQGDGQPDCPTCSGLGRNVLVDPDTGERSTVRCHCRTALAG